MRLPRQIGQRQPALHTQTPQPYGKGQAGFFGVVGFELVIGLPVAVRIPHNTPMAMRAEAARRHCPGYSGGMTEDRLFAPV